MREAMFNRRKEMGKSQEQIADMIKLTRCGYASIERGNKNPSAEVLIALERVMGIPASTLYANTEPEHETSGTHARA